jgi:tryptophan-rich sensory protein
MSDTSKPATGKTSWIALACFFIATALVAWLASSVTDPSTDSWYQNLTLPSFQPPAVAFPIVWTVLYIAMAVAGWRVWRASEGAERLRMTALYGLQLLLNGLWSFAFFAGNAILLAFTIITALWLVLILWTLKARRIDRLAAALFVPYVLWVSFAAVLNGTILALN